MAVAKHTYAFEEKVQVRDVPFRYGPGYDLDAQKPKKKTKKLEDVMPTGIDDGKGARKLLHSYVDEACFHAPRKSHAMINFDILSDDFRSKPFLEQMTHVQMKSIPLLSQIARQDALMPYNNTHKKKHYIGLSKRLRKNDTTLIRARLSSEAIDDSIIKMLEVALQKNTVLQHLALHKNAITDEGVEMLCMALRWHPTLHTLWLGANPFTDIGARHLSLLLNRNRTIKELNISNRWPSQIWSKSEYELHPHVTYVGAQYIAKQLQRGSGLTSLSLSEQRVRDDGAIYLFEALRHCNLRVLNLRGNELSDRCCVELRTCLQGNPILEQLVLSHNRISDEGAINIAYGLASNSVLRVLDLGYNAIESTGLDALFLCLKYNTTLTALITVRNKDPDSRAEATVCARVNSVFGFSSFGSANAATNLHRGSISSAGSVSSAGSRDSSQSKFSYGRRQSQGSASGTTLSLELSLNDGVEVMGKSIHSRSFRSVTIDSKEASRSNSMRGSSFRALSQKSGLGSDAGHSDTGGHSDNDEDSLGGASLTVPPMLGSGKNGPISRARTPPAPMLGSSKIRSPPPQDSSSAATGSPSGKVSVSPTRERAATDSPGAHMNSPKLKGNKSVIIADPNDITGADTEAARPITPPSKLTRRTSSKKFHRNTTAPAEVRELPVLLKTAPPTMVNIGRPVRSRDVGKTVSIPNVRNMGVRPVRTSISPQKDSAQHLLYLRIATPFDGPDERPYSILYVGKDHENEVKRVRKQRQDPQYQYDKAFKIHNTPKVIKHQAALPKVPDYFWDDWQNKIRLQYITGIDNAPGVTSTKLEPLAGSASQSQSASAAVSRSNSRGVPRSVSRGGTISSAALAAAVEGKLDSFSHESIGDAYPGISLSAASESAKLSGITGVTGTDASALDPNSAYFMYSSDPSQAFRKHLSYKAGITPGKILAARRKENAIQRAIKAAEAAEQSKLT